MREQAAAGRHPGQHCFLVAPCRAGPPTVGGLPPGLDLQLAPNPVAHDAQHRALADGRKGAHPQALLQELARGAVTQRLVQALVVVQLSVTKPM
jgi:hypothetical protein